MEKSTVYFLWDVPTRLGGPNAYTRAQNFVKKIQDSGYVTGPISLYQNRGLKVTRWKEDV